MPNVNDSDNNVNCNITESDIIIDNNTITNNLNFKMHHQQNQNHIVPPPPPPLNPENIRIASETSSVNTLNVSHDPFQPVQKQHAASPASSYNGPPTPTTVSLNSGPGSSPGSGISQTQQQSQTQYGGSSASSSTVQTGTQQQSSQNQSQTTVQNHYLYGSISEDRPPSDRELAQQHNQYLSGYTNGYKAAQQQAATNHNQYQQYHQQLQQTSARSARSSGSTEPYGGTSSVTYVTPPESSRSTLSNLSSPKGSLASHKNSLTSNNNINIDKDSEKLFLDPKSVFSYARHGHANIVERCLQAGFNPDSTDPIHGNTLFHVACQNGNRKIAKLAIKYGGSMDKQNNKGNTGLHFLHAYGYGEILDYFVSKGANPLVKNSYGLSCRQGLKGPSGLPTGMNTGHWCRLPTGMNTGH